VIFFLCCVLADGRAKCDILKWTHVDQMLWEVLMGFEPSVNFFFFLFEDKGAYVPKRCVAEQ
jgi:hypothetical protein